MLIQCCCRASKLNIYLSYSGNKGWGGKNVVCTPTVAPSAHPHNSLFIFLIVIVLLWRGRIQPTLKNLSSRVEQARKASQGRSGKSNFCFFINSIQEERRKNAREAKEMLIGILTWIIIKWRSHFRLPSSEQAFGDEFYRLAEPISNCADFHEMCFFRYCHLLCDEQGEGGGRRQQNLKTNHDKKTRKKWIKS